MEKETTHVCSPSKLSDYGMDLVHSEHRFLAIASHVSIVICCSLLVACREASLSSSRTTFLQLIRPPLLDCLCLSVMSTLFGSAASSSSTASNALGDLSKDVAVKDPPEDSISDLAFSPVTDHLAVASWDKKVRIYEIDGQGNSQGKALFEHEGPVLSCAWSKV